jgi:hypothetical protein
MIKYIHVKIIRHIEKCKYTKKIEMIFYLYEKFSTY